ncbi:unnamed protein product [Oppiella nova]|uniref:Nuclear receptor domain-containing protein n=1 Tax=Oppiella nova TaxID=334625 RepID=A0A7R9LE66_9ACAR|nr:unnamed protein product [Oppiella nova]CAG2162218.1 unnamed protein product [Oppiella nova]
MSSPLSSNIKGLDNMDIYCEDQISLLKYGCLEVIFLRSIRCFDYTDNVLKIPVHECLFDNNCKVDVITRRFCTKCRLDKCLAIGMRRECILNEEELLLKRLRFFCPPMGATNKNLDNMLEFYQCFTTKFDTGIRILTKAAKRLSAFRDVCETDQISLLKSGCFGVMFLRSIMFFDYTDNSLKLPMLKCHFDNNCKINEITRKFCSKCRLDKCLAIGMRRDWLLNEEERDMKRLRILETKKKKSNSFNSNTSAESPKSLIDRSPETSHENHISNPINTTNSDIFCEILDDNNFSADALNRQIMDIESTLINGFNEKNSFENTNNLLSDEQISCYNNCNEITSQTDYEVSDETIEKAVEFAVSVIPIARPQRELNTGFNEKEIYLMNELMKWSQFMCTPHISYVNKNLDNMYEFYQYFTSKQVRSITDLTKTVKGLSAFRDICCEDQISLLKYGCFEVIFLRTIVYFDYTDNTLKLPLRGSEEEYDGRHAKDIDSATFGRGL